MSSATSPTSGASPEHSQPVAIRAALVLLGIIAVVWLGVEYGLLVAVLLPVVVGAGLWQSERRRRGQPR